jgi:hypothetical protein
MLLPCLQNARHQLRHRLKMVSNHLCSPATSPSVPQRTPAETRMQTEDTQTHMRNLYLICLCTCKAKANNIVLQRRIEALTTLPTPTLTDLNRSALAFENGECCVNNHRKQTGDNACKTTNNGYANVAPLQQYGDRNHAWIRHTVCYLPSIPKTRATSNSFRI